MILKVIALHVFLFLSVTVDLCFLYYLCVCMNMCMIFILLDITRYIILTARVIQSIDLKLLLLRQSFAYQ